MDVFIEVVREKKEFIYAHITTHNNPIKQIGPLSKQERFKNMLKT